MVIEFFPASQIARIEDAVQLIDQVGGPDVAGINVDLLHLMRSGGSIAQLAAIPAEYIGYAQLCDGPAQCADENAPSEASFERLLPGEGDFDMAGFLAVLPPDCPISVETPRRSDMDSGRSPLDRARSAADGARRIMQAAAKLG